MRILSWKPREICRTGERSRRMSEGGKGTGNGKQEAEPTSQALPCPEVIQFSFETRVATFGPWPIHRAVAMLTGQGPQ